MTSAAPSRAPSCRPPHAPDAGQLRRAERSARRRHGCGCQSTASRYSPSGETNVSGGVIARARRAPCARSATSSPTVIGEHRAARRAARPARRPSAEDVVAPLEPSLGAQPSPMRERDAAQPAVEERLLEPRALAQLDRALRPAEQDAATCDWRTNGTADSDRRRSARRVARSRDSACCLPAS